MDETTGSIENEIETLSDQNEFTQSRIDVLLDRLERQRQFLLDRFIAMESALATLENLRDTISQTFQVLNSGEN